MKIVRTLIAAAALAAFAATPTLAQHSHGGGGGFHGGSGGFHGGGSFHGGGGWHGGGSWHGGSGWHGGGYRGGWYGSRGWGGWYGGDAFALGFLGGYALSAPWSYDYYPGTYAYDYAPPPGAYYDDRARADVYDGSDMQPDANGRHCPLYWDDKTQRYEPHCG